MADTKYGESDERTALLGVYSSAEKQPVNLVLMMMFVLFGIGPYTMQNALVIELNIFTSSQPEGWNLPIVTMVVGVLPALLVLTYASLVEHVDASSIHRGNLVLTFFIIAIIAAFPISLWWNVTVKVMEQDVSIVIIAAAMVSSSLICVVEMIYWPYMQRFDKIYMTGFFLGMTLCSAIFSVLGLIQGTTSYVCDIKNQPIYGEPVFSVTTFLYMATFITVISAFAFVAIQWFAADIQRVAGFAEVRWLSDRGAIASDVDSSEVRAEDRSHKRDCWVLFMLGSLTIFLYSLTPSLTTYATLSYSQATFYWTTILRPLVGPLFSLAAFVYRPHRTRELSKLYVLSVLLTVLMVLVALRSPEPPLKHSAVGGLLSASGLCLLHGVGSFLRPLLIDKYRHGVRDAADERRRIFRTGVVSQACVASGTILMFPFIALLDVFHSAPPCAF